MRVYISPPIVPICPICVVNKRQLSDLGSEFRADVCVKGDSFVSPRFIELSKKSPHNYYINSPGKRDFG